MALHSKTYNINEENWQTGGNDRFDHLQRMIKPQASTRFVMRGPEQKNGGTTLVALPYPEFNDDGTVVAPGRVGDDRLDKDPENPRTYNRWLFKANDRGVTKFGNPFLSLLFDNPEDSGWNFDDDHPIQLIYKHINFAVRKKLEVETPYGSSSSDKWAVLLNGDGGQNYAIIKRPDIQFLFFSLIYKSGKDNFDAAGSAFGAAQSDPLPVFILSRDTATSLMDQLDRPLRNDRPSEGLLHPNVTGCKFVHVYDKQMGTCQAQQNMVAQVQQESGSIGGSRRGPASQAGEQAKTGFGFATFISDTLDGSSGSKRIGRDACAKFATDRVRPWDQVIRGHTPEECAELVQSVCKFPLSVLEYCWATHPEYFTSTTRDRMKAKTTSFIATPGTAGAQQRRTSMLEEQQNMNWDAKTAAAPPHEQEPGQDEGQPDGDTPADNQAPPPAASVYNTAAQQNMQSKFRQALKTTSGNSPTLNPRPTTPNPPPFRPGN